MRFIWQREYQAKLLEWAALHGPALDMRSPSNGARAIGVVVGDKLIAVCIYHHFRDLAPDIEMTMIADNPRWCTKGAVRFLFAYPFAQLGCRRVTALVARKNKRSRRLVEGLGFKLEGTHRRAWDGKQDLMSYGMLREECRWMTPESLVVEPPKEPEDGQEQQAA